MTLRTLGRHRGFTAVAVLSIAIAIALNTTLYSALEAMVDPQIDARHPERVYSFAYFGDRARRLHHSTITDALRAGVQAYESATGSRMARYWNQTPLAENGSRYYRVDPTAVRMNYFEFLGTRAREGRTFVDRDEGTNTAVISDRLANKLFPDESPIGRTMTLDGDGYVVIGVVRRNTTFRPLAGDIWIPQPPGGGPVPLNLMRFREEINPYDIGDQLKVVAARLAIAANEKAGSTSFRSTPLTSRQKSPITPFHFALIGAVAAVLLVACANLANLQLARGLARSRELALRSAVGASRGRLVGTLMLETSVIALSGLVLGLALTLWGVHVLRATIPAEVAELVVEPQTSWGMFAFAATAALVCLFLVGLLPALRISRVDPNELLKSGAGTGANREHRRRYGIMVMAQIGLSLPVLIGAIVLLRASIRWHSPDYLTRNLYGIDPGPIVAASVPLSPPDHVTSILVGDVATQLTSGAASVRGVLDATVEVPRSPEGRRVTVDDADGHIREEPAYQWAYRIVSPSYFRVFGLPIVKGRGFTETETDGNAVVIDERTARFLWQNDNPIGRVIKFGDNKSNAKWHTVVGIVGDLRDTNAIRMRDPTANFRLSRVYRVVTPEDSLVMMRRTRAFNVARGTLTMYARVSGNTELAAVRMQRQLRTAVSANKPTVVRMEDNLGATQARMRADFAASLFSSFALIGIGLVAIGLYGIVAHSVAERRRELAVRISLGATPRNILHSLLREGNVLILTGTAVGLLLTKYSVFWLGQFFTAEADGYDALLFALIACGLFAIAAFAAFVPAWRATKIDPVEALRHE